MTFAWAFAWLVLLAAVAGCRGRSEFTRGRDLYDQGLYRDAYRQFWEAYRISPSDEYFDAFRRAGTRVAVEERLKGQLRERDGDLDGALAAYSLGLEYDGHLPSLRGDYERLWAALERKERLTWRLGGLEPPSLETWEQLRALRALSAFPGSPRWRRPIPQAVRSVAEAAILPLVRATRGEPLPLEETALDALLGAWERFEDECRLFVWEEETIGLTGGWEAAATSRWVEVRDVLRPFLEEAEVSIRRLAAAKRSLALVKRGEELERSGDLVRALATYRRARFESPDYEAAADGEFRVSRLFAAISRHAAREAMDDGEWGVAVAVLEELLRVTPEDDEARRRLAFARSRLAETCLATSRRHLDAGRPATALAFASRAARLDPARGEDLARELREPLIGSFRARPGIRFRPVSQEEWKLRRDLWAVDEEAMRRLEDAVAESARAAGAELLDARGSLVFPDDSPRIVSVEDLEFLFSRGVELTGLDRYRYPRDFGLTDNQDHHSAVEGLAAARRRLGSLLERREQARLPGRALAEELAELAHWQVRQREVQVKSLPRAVAEIDWSEMTHETMHLKRQTRLSGYVRLGERAEWVSVELEFLDRVAPGKPEISLASDPREAPSREEVLLRLGRQLGTALAERVESWRRERLDDLLRTGLEQLEAGDLTGATESFALVHFGRDGHYPDLGEAALERLRALLGWAP